MKVYDLLIWLLIVTRLSWVVVIVTINLSTECAAATQETIELNFN